MERPAGCWLQWHRRSKLHEVVHAATLLPDDNRPCGAARHAPGGGCETSEHPLRLRRRLGPVRQRLCRARRARHASTTSSGRRTSTAWPARGCCSAAPSSRPLAARPAAVRCCPASISGGPAAAPSCAARSGTAPSPRSRCCSATPAITSARRTRSGAPARRTTPPTARANTPTRRPAAASTSSRENVTRMVGRRNARRGGQARCCTTRCGQLRRLPGGRGRGPAVLLLVRPHERASQVDQGLRQGACGASTRTSSKGKMPPFLPDVPEVREDLADYFGEVQAFDAALGVLLKRLEEIGELDNTLVVVSGDHGAPGFPHGKCNLYDFGASVSLAVRWGGARGGRVVDDLVSLTDLAPTFLELGGVAVPAEMTGRSLVACSRPTSRARSIRSRTAVFIGRERHVESARAGFLPYPQRAIRTHDHPLHHQLQARPLAAGRSLPPRRRQPAQPRGADRRHARHLRRRGRRPDQGLAGRPARRPALEAAVRPGLCASGRARSCTT